MAYNIAIDGPAGAGKSTIAKKLAADLGYVYVDTGAMYRAMAYYFLQNGIDAKDENAIADACPNVDVTIQYVNGEQQVILNGENVNGVIRKEEVGNMASATSVYPVVRTKLVELQRQLASKENVIMDGRDIGTVVLPNANVKIYLTASSAVRAKRRFDELTAKGVECDIDAIEKDIIDRDYRDMHRETSPLRQAEDAVLLDSSNLDIDGVVAEMKKIIEGAQMEIADDMISAQTEMMLREFAQNVQMQGINIQQYMQLTGNTPEGMMEQMRPQAEKRIKSRLVLEAVAAAENMEATDEEVENKFSEIADMYGMETEDIKKTAGPAELNQIKEDIKVEKAVNFVTEAAVEI